MAEQKGLIKLKGNLDGFSTYYHSAAKKWVIRKNAHRTKQMMLSKRTFKRVRENMNEFGLSSRIGKSIRMLIQMLGKGYMESYFSGKLNGNIHRIIQTKSGKRGERNMGFTEGPLLQNISLNDEKQLDTVIDWSYSISIFTDRSAINLQNIDINRISAPEGATHFSLLFVAGGVSDWIFNEGAYEEQYDLKRVKTIYKLDDEPLLSLPRALSISLQLPEAVPIDAGLVIVAGISFSQEINGKLYSLESKYGKILGCF